MKLAPKLCLMATVLATVSACSQADSTKTEEAEVDAPKTTETAPVAMPAKPTVAVTVNGVPLASSELAMMVQANMSRQGIPPQMMAQIPPEFRKNIEQNAMNQFIDTSLLFEEAKKRNYSATDAEIEENITKIKVNIGPGSTLEEALAKAGITLEKLRSDIIKDTTTRKLYEAETADVPEPTEKAVSDFYTENADKFTSEESVNASHILVKVEQTATEEEKAAAKKKIEDLHAKAVSGEDFAELAKANSDCPSKEKGGDLGNFGRKKMTPKFEEAAFAQKVGEIGEIVETPFGYHIIKVTEHKEGEATPIEEVSPQIKEWLQMQAKNKKIMALAATLRESAKIEYAEGMEPPVAPPTAPVAPPTAPTAPPTAPVAPPTAPTAPIAPAE